METLPEYRIADLLAKASQDSTGLNSCLVARPELRMLLLEVISYRAMTDETPDSGWKDLLPSGYRIEIAPSTAPDEYVLWRDGQNVGHRWPSFAKAVCYAYYLDGAIGSPESDSSNR